jgi:hypothetical protein
MAALDLDHVQLAAAGRIFQQRGFRLESEWTERAFGREQRWQTHSLAL